MKSWARGRLRWPALGTMTVRTLSWLLLLAIALNVCHFSVAEPTLELEVEVAGCDPVVVPVDASHPDGRACEVWGVSPFEGARGRKPAGTVTLWIKVTEHARVVVATDGRWSEPLVPVKEEQGGQRHLIAVDKGAGEVTVTARRGRKSRVYGLPIVTAAATPELSELREAILRRKRGAPDGMTAAEAREALESDLYELVRGGDPDVGAKAIGQLARIHSRDDDPRPSFDLFRKAMNADRARGLVADELADGLAFVRLLVSHHAIDEAHAVLDRITQLSKVHDFAVGAALIPYYGGLVPFELADLGAAHRLTSISEERATRLDLEGHLGDVYQKLLELLPMLGRNQEAEVIFRSKLKEPDDANACALAQYYTNRGWYRLLAGSAAPPGAKVDLEEARRLYASTCDDQDDRRTLLTNLAILSLDLGELDEAERNLEEARRALPDATIKTKVEWMLVDARLSLRRGRSAEAEASFREAERLSQAAGLLDYAVDATLGRAESLERSNRRAEALKAHAEADDQLNRWSQLIPFGKGKQTFLARREHGVERYLSLLLAESERREGEREALVRRMACVARRSQSRVLAAMEWSYHLGRAPSHHAGVARAAEDFNRARRDLTVRASQVLRLADPAEQEKQLASLVEASSRAAGELDEVVARVAGARPAPTCESESSRALMEPGKDEVALVYHPLGAGQWLGMAISRARALAARVSFDPKNVTRPDVEKVREKWLNELGQQLLTPFMPVLRGEERRLRVFAAEPLGLIDIHDLPFGGPGAPPLGTRFSVSNGVDLAPPAAAVRARRALVVSVATNGLSMPAQEASHVRDALQRDGWVVRELTGDAATHDAVRRELMEPGLELFHYTGHGVARGADGWESHVMLGRGQWLLSADVSALPRAPRLVVLASCEAASDRARADRAPDKRAYAEGASLANAFLVAGAERVIASPYRNNDATTMQVMKELYRNHLSALLTDPSVALRESLEALRARPDMAYVNAFPRLRVIAR